MAAAITSPLTGNEPAAKPASNEKTRIENPYLAARREWDERYGHLVSRERNWRVMALLCALSSLITIAGLVWLSARSHVVPFVVAMDSLGRPVAAGPAEQTTTADDRIKRATLYTWLENLRLVTSDGVAQRKSIDRVYAYIASGSQAQAFISDFYRSNPPQKRAQTETVSVEVQSVLPTSDKTFEIEWTETTRDLYGTVTQKARWKAAFTIAINPPTDEATARDRGQLKIRRGQLNFPSRREEEAIQVNDDLYGERSAGKAAVAAETKVVAGGCGGEIGNGFENGAQIPAGPATAERDARKARVANAARSICRYLGSDSGIADRRAGFASEDVI